MRAQTLLYLYRVPLPIHRAWLRCAPASFNPAKGVAVVLESVLAACFGQALLKEQINECMNQGEGAIAPREFWVPDAGVADILPRRHN